MNSFRDRYLRTIQTVTAGDETVERVAMGIRMPSFWLLLPCFLLGVLPGVIAQSVFTRYFIVALTNRRLIIAQVGGMMADKIKTVTDFPIEEIGTLQGKLSNGVLAVHFKILNTVPKFRAAFSKVQRDNREDITAIASAIGHA